MAEPLPQLAGDRLFIGDGGLETSLIFHQGLELPDFAAFTLLADDAGREAIRAYFEPYLAIARERDVGFVLDTVTWRASPDSVWPISARNNCRSSSLMSASSASVLAQIATTGAPCFVA